MLHTDKRDIVINAIFLTYNKSHIDCFFNEMTSCLALCRELVYNNVIPHNITYKNLYALLNESLSNPIKHMY